MRIPMTLSVFRASVGAAVLFALAAPAAAQSGAASMPPSSSSSSTGRVGVSITAAPLLGFGGDVAVRLNEHANIRGGFNTFSLSHDFDDNGAIYTGKVKLQSIHAFVDWFPFAGAFHLSPGLVFANDTNVSLSSAIAGGKTIEIGDTTYVSSSTNPIKGTGSVTVKSSALALMMGWGNIAGGHHFTVPFELGVVFQGAPIGVLSFTGTACNQNGSNCRDIGTDATIQAEVKKQNVTLNDTSSKYGRYLPVVSLGFGIRF